MKPIAICRNIAIGTFLAGFGSSSLRWEHTSGVPTEYWGIVSLGNLHQVDTSSRLIQGETFTCSEKTYGTVQHTSDENKAVGVSHARTPFTPYEGACRMTRSAACAGQNCKHNDCDDEADEYKEHSQVVGVRHGSVEEDDRQAS